MRDHSLTPIPPGFVIKKLPARVAFGAVHKKLAPRGDAQGCIFQAARATGTIANQANHRASVRHYAAQRAR